MNKIIKDNVLTFKLDNKLICSILKVDYIINSIKSKFAISYICKTNTTLTCVASF